jgi:polar amino acid transport system substrate-binding protein
VRAARVLVALVATAAAVLPGCSPDREPFATPTTTAPPATPGPASTCTEPNEQAARSFPPSNNPDAAKAQTIRKDRLVVGVSADTYLIGSRDENADLEGFDVDIAKEIARLMFGDPKAIEFKVLTVPQRIPALVNGEVDLVANSLTVTCARWDQINFSTEYLRSGQKLLVRADAAAAGIDTLEKLAGRRVCASRGGTGAANLKQNFPQIEAVEVEDRGDCLVKFQRGEADAILNGDNLLAGFVPQDQYAARVVGDWLTTEPTAIGVKKENVELTRYVNHALEDIRRTAWTGIYNKWLLPVLGAPPEPRFAPPAADHSRTP